MSDLTYLVYRGDAADAPVVYSADSLEAIIRYHLEANPYAKKLRVIATHTVKDGSMLYGFDEHGQLTMSPEYHGFGDRKEEWKWRLVLLPTPNPPDGALVVRCVKKVG